MDAAFADMTPLWDLSQANTFSQLADDDFLALLQKQFPTAGVEPDFSTGSVDPQDISRYSLPTGVSPESSGSSPDNGNKDDSPDGNELKRKASDDDLEEGGSSKHTNKKSNNGRRKSGTGSDETRLMKRKEQNRAAQRAFRERKEKHVKDLEDKVADLQAQNEAANRENENMRDLLTRLQSENMALKQQPFTFQVSKPGQSSTASSSVGSLSTPSTTLLSPSSTSFTSSFTSSQPKPANEKYTNPLDISSLQSFDPSVLDLLDAPAEPTATSHASDMDLGFKQDSGFLTSNFTTIANNPQYYSLSSFWDSLGSNDSTPSGSAPTTSSTTTAQKTPDPNAFNFDMSSFSWGGAENNGTLDDLFGAGFGPFSMDHGLGNGLMGSSPASTSSLSPVVHMQNPQQHMSQHSPSSSSSSSSPQSDPSLFGTPRDGNSSASDSEGVAGVDKKDTCPKTRKECKEHQEQLGMSPFVTQDSGAFARKDVPAPSCMGPGMSTMTDGMGNPMSMPFGPVVACQGSSSFPKTAKSDSNVEVLTAWRTITSNPRFKDCDINELCTEFSNKAKCDGTKVVLEPSGVKSIMSTLGKRA